jgi:DNA-binding CsgD family transcriptional regulator
MTGEGQTDAVPTEADPSAAIDEGLPRLFGTSAPTIVALVIAICISADLVSDLRDGRVSPAHMLGMFIGSVLSFVGLVVMWRLMRLSRARARALKVALDSTRTDLMEWRARSSTMLEGLGALIDRQFADWALSSAEREVGLLLLKGLSLKGIADLRETSERTVRQQALAIYRKAGIAGRAELSAFFLEDLLLPRSQPGTEAPQRAVRVSAAGARRG